MDTWVMNKSLNTVPEGALLGALPRGEERGLPNQAHPSSSLVSANQPQASHSTSLNLSFLICLKTINKIRAYNFIGCQVG